MRTYTHALGDEVVALFSGAAGPVAQARALQVLASQPSLLRCEGRVGSLQSCWGSPYMKRAALADMCNPCLWAALHARGERV